jgi:predicted glutamate--cysteine ligase
LRHWQDGRPILAQDWVEELYGEVWSIAKKHGFSCFLLPLKKILREGNEAQRWMHRHQQGWSNQQIIVNAIQEMQTHELSLQDELCLPHVA